MLGLCISEDRSLTRSSFWAVYMLEGLDTAMPHQQIIHCLAAVGAGSRAMGTNSFLDSS